MKFLADRIDQLEASCREGLLDAKQLVSRRNLHSQGETITLEKSILQSANALIDAEADWLLQKLMSDLSFARAELGNGAIEEVSRCATRVGNFIKSRRDFESSEFWSILHCADRIFSG